MGINLAIASNLDRSLFNYGVRDSRRKCIFISHNKADEEAAIAIGDYLTKIANVNIYLDVKDCILQEAVSEENDRKIVTSIQTGLNLSTHLLCVISDQTRLSWWVPYEIGFADRQNVEITSLMLKKADDIPSFLKINKSLKNTDDFLHYISDFGEYGSLTRDFKYEELSNSNLSSIQKYIR